MDDVERLLRDQWAELRGWLASEQVLDHADEPSGLPHWRVRDLVIHLGYGLRMTAEVGDADGEQPLDVIAYVAGYAPAQHQIADDTIAIAASLRGRELPGLDSLADEAWQALDRGLPAIVRGRRGPLRRDDFLRTRLIELVVHGDDLHRGRAGARSPLLPEAVAHVADVLGDGYGRITGRRPPARGLALVRLASGRQPSDDPALPLLA